MGIFVWNADSLREYNECLGGSAAVAYAMRAPATVYRSVFVGLSGRERNQPAVGRTDRSTDVLFHGGDVARLDVPRVRYRYGKVTVRMFGLQACAVQLYDPADLRDGVQFFLARGYLSVSAGSIECQRHGKVCHFHGQRFFSVSCHFSRFLAKCKTKLPGSARQGVFNFLLHA